MNTTLAVTISPRDRVGEYVSKRMKHPLRCIYDDDEKVIRRALNRSSKEYTIYPELDDTGRLHYHGTVKVYDMLKWKTNTCTLLKTLGFINVKSNPNSGWDTYVTKEWEQTKKALDLAEPMTWAPLKRGPQVREVSEIDSRAKRNIIFDYL